MEKSVLEGDLETLPAPARRIVAEAAAAQPAAVSAFVPTPMHYAVAGALFESTEPLRSFKDIAVAAGVPERKVLDLVQNPAACNWVVAHAAGIARVGLSACYARLMHEALNSNNPNWMSMFLKRFDPEYAKAEGGVGTLNMQINNFRNYTTEELTAFVRQKKRLKLGAEAEAS